MTALLRRPPPSADRRNRWELVLPLLALVSLVGAVAAVALGVSGEDGLLALGRLSARAVAFFILTWAFALVSPAALLVVLHSLLRRPSRRWSTRLGRLHDGVVALACTILAIHLATWGVVGLRTWVY